MSRSVWTIAAENGALPGGKVGGVGDVVRDLPPALQAEGMVQRVVVPAYGRFHRLPGASLHRRVHFRFGGHPRRARIFQLPARPGEASQFVVDHPLITQGQPGQIYIHDQNDRPFFSDARRFACFAAAVAAWVESSREPPAVLHLHDWHCGLLPWLRALAPADSALRRARMVFTIHNLAYQGIRPLTGESSLEEWFPDNWHEHQLLLDPRYRDCINFMAGAIRLADSLSTVSPSYAKEILLPNDPARGFHGGEGLETLLQDVAAKGQLVGILNGCAYPATSGPKANAPASADPVADWPGLLQQIGKQRWGHGADLVPARLEQLAESGRPRHVLLSIGRLVEQKYRLLLQPTPAGTSALQAILERLGSEGVLIVLGSGAAGLEQGLAEFSQSHANLLFLNGYAESLSEFLYASADLFLMPSSFEPCGISQMLAMRAGQPCVVHAVGGLADTVEEGVTGFSFAGSNPTEQAGQFVAAVWRALELHERDPTGWQGLRQRCAAQRFSWQQAARHYLRLYRLHD